MVPSCPSTTAAATSWRSRAVRTSIPRVRTAGRRGTRSRAWQPSRRTTGERSTPVVARGGPADGVVAVRVDAGLVIGPLHRPWRPMIGSEHLALLLHGAGPGGHHVGSELAEAFRIVHRELRVASVRAHAVFDDELTVYRDSHGTPVHDFSTLDGALEIVLDTGLRPVVELSFMPRDLARDPMASVFEYGAIVSPPRDIGRWGDLVRDLVAHLADRFGRDEVRAWTFEVWNEPNMGLFWRGSESDYVALYGAAARAVKAVDPVDPRRWPGDGGSRLDRRLPGRVRGGRPAAGLPLHPLVRRGADGPAAEHAAGRPSGPAAPVDRVGRQSTARCRSQRQSMGGRR